MKSLPRSRPFQIGLAAFALLNFAHAGVMAQDTYRAYYGNDPVGRNLVTILSEAPLETMMTRTSAVEADIHVNPKNPLDNPKARFVIDANSLDTGIGLRNEHMKSAEWLDTAKYPTITFTLTKPLVPTDPKTPYMSKEGNKGHMPVEGELELHGIKKTIQADVSVDVIAASAATKDRLDGDMLHIRASFPLVLSDFGINVPEPASLKVANEEQVKVDVFVSTGSKAPAWAG